MTESGNGKPLKSLLTQGAVSLRAMQESDLETVRNWRNDPLIRTTMLTQSLISREEQHNWFERVRQAPDQQHFLIRHRDAEVGVANIKTPEPSGLIDCREAEAGIYIGNPEYRGGFIAFIAAVLLNEYCFGYLGIQTLTAIVLTENQAAMNFNQQLGYQVIDENREMKGHRIHRLGLSAADFKDASESIRRFIRN